MTRKCAAGKIIGRDGLCTHCKATARESCGLWLMQEAEMAALARDAAQFLWGLLDDIDTASDRAKSDDRAYRQIVERLQRRRFEVGKTDGYAVTFLARNTKQCAETEGVAPDMTSSRLNEVKEHP